MIQLSNEYKRNLLFTNTNKALLDIVKNATPEQLTQLKESKDVKSLITSLFQEKLTGNKSDQLLLEMLKSSPQFKSLGNFSDNLKNLLNDLKSTPNLPIAALEKFVQNAINLTPQTLQKQINNSGVFMESKIASFIQQSSAPSMPLPNLSELKTELSALYTKMLPVPQSEKILDGIEKLLNTLSKPPMQELKTLIQDLKPLSHELQESPQSEKISHHIDSIIPKLTALLNAQLPTEESTLPALLSDDLKSSLLKLSEELHTSESPDTLKQLEQIDKLLTQIDYHQLESYLTHSSSLFFPFDWHQLEEGSVRFKKKDQKKSYCSINLKFKEYGELDLMMSLYDEHQLEIHFHTEKDPLNALIKERLGELREVLSKTGFFLKTVQVHAQSEKHQHDAYSDGHPSSHGGFEVTV